MDSEVVGWAVVWFLVGVVVYFAYWVDRWNDRG